MTRISVGDASLTNILARQGADLRNQVQRASTEVATGRHSDIAAVLRGDVSPLLAIDASLSRLAAFQTTTTDVAFQASAQQSVLSSISSLADGITTTLIAARDFPTTAQVDTVAADARARLESVVGLLNTQASGRAVFSGMATDTAPLASSEALLDALQAAVSSAVNAQEVADGVSAWFADPEGYGAFYQGGDPLHPIPVGPGETATLSTTALDPTLRDTLAGFAMAALIDRGVLGGDADQRARLAERAGQKLMASEDSRTTLAARIGTVEAQIEDARTRNAAEATSLGILRSDIGSADPYEAATRLESASTQLESLYLVTSRVSQLRLVDFLR
jgi:flagellar hook-associated protein 3 FlgL